MFFAQKKRVSGGLKQQAEPALVAETAMAWMAWAAAPQRHRTHLLQQMLVQITPISRGFMVGNGG